MFTCTASGTAKYGPGCFSTPSAGSYSYSGTTGTWTGDAASFTLTASSNQVRATKIEVTYTPSSTGTKTATTLAFADPADKTFDLNAENGSAIFSNPATLTPAVEGATITYSSSNENLATVEPNGDVLVATEAEGTATITATYAGNDEYLGSTASYKITVADPNKASWSYTFQSKDLVDGTTSYNFNNVAWTFTPTWKSDAYYGNLDNSRGLQLGSSKKPATSLIFSTTGFPGVIKEVKVNAATASGATATIAVTVGGVGYGDAKSLTTSSADYTFTGSASGEVVITLSQPSTSAALYIKSIDIEYNPSAATTLTLDENATEAAITAGKNVNVTLKRTFNDNAWNTLVLPFDLTAEQIADAFGADAKVAAYTGATAGTDGTYTLNFTEATSITANTPVFIHSAQNNTDGYTFTGVEVKDATPTQTADGFNFVGTYTATTVPAGNYFINSSNKFFKAGDDKTNIKGTRATFEPVGTAATSAKGLGFNVTEDGTTTAINSITMQEELNANAPMYNLAGQQVTKAYKGVILQNGKKFINK